MKLNYVSLDLDKNLDAVLVVRFLPH